MKKTFLTDQTDDTTWYTQTCIDSHEMRCMSCGTQIKDSRSKLIKFQRFKSGLTTMTIWFFHAKIQDQKYRSSEFSLGTEYDWSWFFSAFRSAAIWCARTVPWRPESGWKWNSHWPDRVHCQRSCTATTCIVLALLFYFSKDETGKAL